MPVARTVQFDKRRTAGVATRADLRACSRRSVTSASAATSRRSCNRIEEFLRCEPTTRFTVLLCTWVRIRGSSVRSRHRRSKLPGPGPRTINFTQHERTVDFSHVEAFRFYGGVVAMAAANLGGVFCC